MAVAIPARCRRLLGVSAVVVATFALCSYDRSALANSTICFSSIPDLGDGFGLDYNGEYWLAATVNGQPAYYKDCEAGTLYLSYTFDAVNYYWIISPSGYDSSGPVRCNQANADTFDTDPSILDGHWMTWDAGSGWTLDAGISAGAGSCPRSLSVSNGPGSSVVVEYQGIVQLSTNLLETNGWVDINPQPDSPWAFTPTNHVQFFRLKPPYAP